jgi:MYXO-CTERM domain-containing protein
MFANAPSNTYTDPNGDTFLVNYMDIANGDLVMNDISLTVLTIIPEPGTWVTGALVLGALVLSQRRRVKDLLRAKR